MPYIGFVEYAKVRKAVFYPSQAYTIITYTVSKLHRYLFSFVQISYP